MAQYVDKSALIAEIKRIEHETNYEAFTDEVLGKRYVCKSLLSFLGTLEAKEVDLEKEFDNYTKDTSVLGMVEPKFHEGDWVVNKFGDSWHINSFDKKNYQVSDGKGNYNYFPISKQSEMHLWTIQDAKDGDVLACNEEILLFKSYSIQGRISLYC